MVKKILLFVLLLCNFNCASHTRSIAVLAYGSLINEPSRGGHTLDIKTPFAAADLTLPISMRRHSQKESKENERITAIIDKSQGHPKALYFATMNFSQLKAARENLSWREGSEGKLTNIFYIKKNLPDLATENSIPGTADWFIRKPQGQGEFMKDVQLSDEEAKKIADWASSKGYDAVIWCSYPPNLASEKEAAEKLVNPQAGPNLYKNTVEYIQQLPHKAETNFEKAVISGPEALKSEYGL